MKDMSKASDLTIELLAHPCRALEATDGLGKAVEALRQSGVSALPVVASGRLLGMVSEGDIMRLLTREAAADNIEGLRTTPVSRAMTFPIVAMHAGQTLEQARELFASSDLRVLPVVDQVGVCRGVVTRADVMSAIFGVTTPPRVGGLATPLGVFLTTGSVRGGASNLGLLLTGAALVILFVAASLLTNLLTLGLERWLHLPLFSLAVAREAPANEAYARGAFAGAGGILVAAVQIVIFFILLRLAPLTGIHAAEHMVVHAIEDGDELTPQRVATKPRVHPRCGTNLMALVFIAAAGFWLISAAESLLGSAGFTAAVLALLFVIYFLWRSVGAGIQRFLTTKRPSRRQLENGIRAGRELLARYQQRPAYRASGMARLWNMGIVQVAAGFICTWLAADYLSSWLRLGLFPFSRW
jgi:predicted transcriptional regulator